MDLRDSKRAMGSIGDERVVRIGGDGPALDARFARLGRDIAIVAAPHPLMGGQMANPVVTALVEGFQRAEWSTLRFDFRGVGESAGVASGDLTEAVADYRRVVGWARAQESVWMTFGGYSFGALAAIHTHLDGLDCHAIAAVAPPVQGLTMEMMRRLDCYFALMCGTHDTFIDSYEMMDLLTHVRMAQYSLIETDHFFIGRRDELVDYAEKLARDLTAAKVAPPVSDNEIDPEDLL